jgi:uncharacterized YccA/Bax inhibitor family protein
MANPVMKKAFAPQTRPIPVSPDSPSGSKMTKEGTIQKTLFLFAILVASAAFAWTSHMTVLALPAFIVAMGIGIYLWFRQVSAPLAIAYSVAEGILIGFFSQSFESSYPGIVQTAVVITLMTSGVCFILWRMGIVKVTDKFRSFIYAAVPAYFFFWLFNVGRVSLFHQQSIYSMKYGWIASVIGLGIAIMTLFNDFDFIEKGVAQSLPAKMEWTGAYALMTSILWMYIEIIRLLARLQGGSRK